MQPPTNEIEAGLLWGLSTGIGLFLGMLLTKFIHGFKQGGLGWGDGDDAAEKNTTR